MSFLKSLLLGAALAAPASAQRSLTPPEYSPPFHLQLAGPSASSGHNGASVMELRMASPLVYPEMVVIMWFFGAAFSNSGASNSRGCNQGDIGCWSAWGAGVGHFIGLVGAPGLFLSTFLDPTVDRVPPGFTANRSVGVGVVAGGGYPQYLIKQGGTALDVGADLGGDFGVVLDFSVTNMAGLFFEFTRFTRRFDFNVSDATGTHNFSVNTVAYNLPVLGRFKMLGTAASNWFLLFGWSWDILASGKQTYDGVTSELRTTGPLTGYNLELGTGFSLQIARFTRAFAQFRYPCLSGWNENNFGGLPSDVDVVTEADPRLEAGVVWHLWEKAMPKRRL